MQLGKPWKSLKVRVTVLTSLLWLVSLWGLTFLVSVWLRADLQAVLSSNQRSTAAIIAAQVNTQLTERLNALAAVATSLTPDLLQQPESLQKTLDDKPVLLVLFNAGAYVVAQDGVARASIPRDIQRVGLNYRFRGHVRRALDEGVASVSDVVVGQAIQAPALSIAVPIRDRSGRVIGALAGVINLTLPNFLDDLTTVSSGAEGYLLVARDQRLIVTASDKTRIMEKLPPIGTIPGIDAVLEGNNGDGTLLNPKGVEVLFAAHQIPLPRWYAVSSTPTAEAFRPVVALQDRMLWAALGLTLITAVLNWLLLRRQLSPVVDTIRTLSKLTASPGTRAPLPVVRRDEIGDLIESFNRLLAALDERERDRVRYEALANRTQRLEALGLLAGGISHDFNNLLAGVFGNIELAILRAGDSPAVPYLHRTMATLGRARDLTRQLLTFSKGGVPALESGELFPFVEETTRFALGGSPVSCTFEVASDLRPCRFDRNQISQVIENLVINARQAMPEGGQVKVTARNSKLDGAPAVEIAIADNGPGMAPEVLDHLFEPFFTTKPTGHGLGLSTCYSIVRKHGGTLDVDTELGRGTTFRILLPGTDEAKRPAPVLTNAHHGTGTVLIMDDEVPVGLILQEFLESFGYAVVRTESGEQALAAFRAERQAGRRIVAAILDLVVPGSLGGVETLKGLKALDPALPVLVASGFAEGPILTNPTAYGFRAALRKPYRLEDLDRAMNELAT